MNQGSRVISFWNSEAPRRHRRPPHFLAALTQCPPLAHYHSLSLDQRLVSRDSSLCSPERGPSGQPSSRQVPWGSFTSASRAQRPRGPSSLLGSPSCPARDSRSCPPTHSLTCRYASGCVEGGAPELWVFVSQKVTFLCRPSLLVCGGYVEDKGLVLNMLLIEGNFLDNNIFLPNRRRNEKIQYLIFFKKVVQLIK